LCCKRDLLEKSMIKRDHAAVFRWVAASVYLGCAIRCESPCRRIEMKNKHLLIVALVVGLGMTTMLLAVTRAGHLLLQP
jgi:hypothetical protein